MRRALLALLLANFVLARPGVAPAGSEDKESLAQKARAGYYNLPRLGVASYRCEAVTEWEVMLAGEADPEALKKSGGTEILNGIHIWMTIGKSGDPKFEQRLEGPISDPKRKEMVDMLVRKQEKVLARFARDVTRYMFTSMIPSPDQNYKLEEKDGHYVISESEGSSTAHITMERDYRITEFNASLEKSNVKMNPQFIKTSGGYLLTSQHTEVKSSVPGESSVLSELLEYAEIDGVRLPSKLTAIVSREGAPGGKSRTIQFTFRDFQIQKK